MLTNFLTLEFSFYLAMILVTKSYNFISCSILKALNTSTTGAISGILAMTQFTSRFTPLNGNSYNQGLFVAAILLTAMLGSLLTGYAADKIGRKWTIMLGSFVYAFGIMFEIIGVNFGMMVAGRLIGGFGNGLLTNAIPLYQ
jgi:MFS family permease